jgi:Tfp pilus assembly protein PilF
MQVGFVPGASGANSCKLLFLKFLRLKGTTIEQLKFKRVFMSRFKFLLIFLVAISTAALGQSEASSVPSSAPGLGQVSFPISCKAEVRPVFERGVALLHSFQYAAAEKSFNDVSSNDPQCAMAYWGLAMTVYHPLWEGANDKALTKGRQYLEKARAIGTADQREREYIDALWTFYTHQGDKRLIDYSSAMAEICKHYPQDGEAQAFYALSLLALPQKGDDLETRKQAIAILNKLSAAQPEHPGAVHYLIHAADTPELASEGLEAARRYAKIAPDSSHALHMPSHIFVRLGLWQESIDSNQAAALAAAEATKNHLGEAHYQFHAMDFLDYSYLQIGEEGKARQIVADLDKVPGRSAEVTTNIRVNFTTRNALELHRWKDALALAPEGDAFDQELIFMTRAIAAARTGEIKLAQENLKSLKKAAVAEKKRDKRWEGFRRDVAESWLDFARGKQEKALKKMRVAADLQDRDDPGPFSVSAREMLADMLLEAHRPDQALREYEAVLKLVPNRFNALYGAARAAETAGDSGKAKEYFSRLRENCPAQADREELQHVKVVAAGSQ